MAPHALPTAARRLALAAPLGLALFGGALGCVRTEAAVEQAAAAPATAPELLSQTGLFADVVSGVLAEGVRPFAPQYPLWTDGAAKRRWIFLPAGSQIDARDPDAWSFPVGTKFWKEFRFERKVETRTMERAIGGSWLYATYLWREDGSDAVRAPEDGVRAACATASGTKHDVPSLLDCRACHEGSPSRVLGFGALQLSAERDPAAPHAELPEPGSLQLDELLAEGRLLGEPADLRAAAEPIAARTGRERAALGYLHGNCGGCHNASGPLAPLGLELRFRHGTEAPAIATTLGRKSQFQPNGATDAVRIAPGAPEGSVLYQRMASRFGPVQMPPLGTHAVDADALALIRDWIQNDLTDPVVVSQAR